MPAAYYLTLFKTKGHKTWRAHLCMDPGGFKREVIVKQAAKVTEMKTLRIDKETCDIEMK